MTLPVNSIICGDWIEVLKEIPDRAVHLVVTSPPYWGQRLYGWGGDGSCEENEQPHKWQDISDSVMVCANCNMKAGKLGLEETPEEHIEKLVVGFREVRRVLRDDGVVFLNYGDKYNAGRSGGHPGGKHSGFQQVDGRYQNESGPNVVGLKPGDLLGLAWRLALALQADGWYLRSDIVWAKALSFCDVYSGSTMPESVNGWRWERHRAKTGTRNTGQIPAGWRGTTNPDKQKRRDRNEGIADWRDCPGCPKCEPNGGLILRKGSWRPTRAHEYLFLLAKTSDYFCDMEAVREENVTGNDRADDCSSWKHAQDSKYGYSKHIFCNSPSGRNLRDVWCINPQAYPDAHYATFPEDLVEPCIKVGTSEKGCCPKCGAPWARIVESNTVYRERPHAHVKYENGGPSGQPDQRKQGVANTTLGWRPTCKHDEEPVPCVVLDPFCGSGTVPAEAVKLGRNYIGIELNRKYVDDQALPRIKSAETGLTPAEQKAGQKGLWE